MCLDPEHPRASRTAKAAVALTVAAAQFVTVLPTADAAARVHEKRKMTRFQRKVMASYQRYATQLRRQQRQAKLVVRFVYRQLGKPYRYGGAGPSSYDCSGLAQAAWRRAGVALPHNAFRQYVRPRRKVSMKGLRPGDLVFFSGRSHVGVYVGHNRFIHAPHTGSHVRREKLTGWRRHAFAGAVRPGAPENRNWPWWVEND